MKSPTAVKAAARPTRLYVEQQKKVKIDKIQWKSGNVTSAETYNNAHFVHKSCSIQYSKKYSRVESRHGLGQLSGTNLGTNISTCTSPCASYQHQLPVGGDVSGIHVRQGGGQARADA